MSQVRLRERGQRGLLQEVSGAFPAAVAAYLTNTTQMLLQHPRRMSPAAGQRAHISSRRPTPLALLYLLK